MQDIRVELKCEIPNSFRTKKACDSVDLDIEKKSTHELNVKADIETPYKIGLIVGSSGSGKTTLAKHLFGDDCFKEMLDLSKPIIEQFPDDMLYDDIVGFLNGIGLTSVPCWVRPAYTLSNGQRVRAESALQMATKDTIILDEWTSVVDRTVAKVMSHCIAKFAKRNNKKLILVSCHYDVIEWLDPDWIIDCNEQKYIDRRLLQPVERKRKEELKFYVAECDKSSWKYFSKYHYLSDKTAGGSNFFYGLYLENGKQVGFGAYTNYIPRRAGKKIVFHSNRVVIHPDFCGFGLARHFVNETAKDMQKKGHRVLAKFSSKPMAKWRKRDEHWKLVSVDRKLKNRSPRVLKNGRVKVKTWTFEFVNP